MDRQTTILDNISYIYHYFKWVVAAIAAYWGAVPELTQLLVYLMAVDMAFGIWVAIKQRNLSATRAWDGVTKKLGTLGMVVVAALVNPHIQNIIEVNLVQAASAFYIAPELLSIMRNAAILDIPVFSQLTPVLRYFQSAGEPKEEDGNTNGPVPKDAR